MALAMSKQQAYEAVRALLDTHAGERKHFDRIHQYLVPWTAEIAVSKIGVNVESKNRDRFAELARMSHTPFINLVIDTYGQSLKVDGFYNSEAENLQAWTWWQRNRMQARQTGLHRDALTYGTSYASALPAAGGGVRINTHSPRRMVTFYGEPMGLPGLDASADEYPILAMEIGCKHLRLFDESHVYYFGINRKPNSPLLWTDQTYMGAGNLPFLEIREHGVGVTPIVRYKDRWMSDGEEQRGIVEPLLGLQDRIDMTNFEQGQTQFAAAFKQRYVIGWKPESRDEAIRQSVAETQFYRDSDVKTGQYDESDLTRYIESRQATVRDLAAVAQVPAQSLGANAISNISADGLAALETSKDRKAAEIQTSLGESHEQLLRLSAFIAGDYEAAEDFESEVSWEETSARTFAQTVDALGKLATMLDIPAEELWADIPGWTKERVERAKKTRKANGVSAGLYFDEDPTAEA
ncbi:hypothetical protein AY535_08620 [Corynebacterium diphtheriae bv. gravis]|nr:hypothetical protein AY535_08620 [Corynebacterium diphtheriae bv. gravis]OWX96602.1 hypothetical protein B1A53_10925 [Corynebacterium diphtheriae]